MATILQQNQSGKQDEEKDKAVITSGESSQVSQGQASNVNQPAARAPSSSGRFTNIQNFINANKSGQIGQQVTEKVGGEKQKATEKLAKTKQDFGGQISQVAQGVNKSKQDVNQAINNISAGGTYSAQAPVADAAIQNIQKALQLKYSGPQSLGNEQQLAGEAQNLTSLGKLSQDNSGRVALLQRFFGRERPTYSSGQTRLDNLLLGRQNQALSDIRQAGRGFNKDLNEANQTALKDITRQKQNIDALKQGVKGQVQSTLSSGESAALAAARQAADEYQGRVRDFLGNSRINLSSDVFLGDNSAPEREGGLPALWGGGPTTANYQTRLSAADLSRLGLVNTDDFADRLAAGDLTAASQLDTNRANTLARLAEVAQLNTNLKSGQEQRQLKGPEIDQNRLDYLNSQFGNLLKEELQNTKGVNTKNLINDALLKEQGYYSGPTANNNAERRAQTLAEINRQLKLAKDRARQKL